VAGASIVSVYALTYHSRNRLIGFTLDRTSEVMNILETSRSRNAEAGVTGALMFNEQRFVQILEGERSAVEETFERIQCDARHTAIAVISRRKEPWRHFGAWSMAYVGRSRQARAYYWYFTRQQDFLWERTDGAVITQLMLNMIDLDDARFLRQPTQ
jgi:blue light- and temperature-responsive anti-repressor